MKYEEIVNRAYSNEVIIGVEPSLARKFFTDTNHEVIQEQIGEYLHIERCIVISLAFILQSISLLTGIIFCIFAVYWYSILIVPIMLLGWFVYSGLASAGRQKIVGVLFFSIVCFFLAYYFRSSGISTVIWLVLLPLPYLFVRLTYKFASVFLRSLALRNEKVFNMLKDKAIFIQENV